MINCTKGSNLYQDFSFLAYIPLIRKSIILHINYYLLLALLYLYGLFTDKWKKLTGLYRYIYGFCIFLNIFSIAKNRGTKYWYVQLLIQNYSRFCYVNWIHINTIRCYGACFITLFMEYKNICILQFINLINLYFDLIIWVLSISIRFLFADW